MTTVVFAEENPMFALMAAIVSPRVAVQRREDIDAFLASGDLRGSEVVKQLRREHGLDRLDLECVIAGSRYALEKAIQGAEVVVCLHEKLDAALLARGERLRLVQKYGTGLRNIDTQAAATHGIPVAVFRRGGNMRVAEHSVALMLALAKAVGRGDRAVRAGVNASVTGPKEDWALNWPRINGLGMGLRGKKLGLLGYGEIGIEVARIAQALQMEICYHQRQRDPQREAEVPAQYVSKNELFACADVVDIHMPPLETPGFVGRREFALMKSSAYLVNTSRAQLVDEEAVVDALSSGAIAGAAFDNFWREPLATDHPLITMENVILTPHIAGGSGLSPESIKDDQGGLLENIARVAAGQAPQWTVKP